jgi:hypothetical protein
MRNSNYHCQQRAPDQGPQQAEQVIAQVEQHGDEHQDQEHDEGKPSALHRHYLRAAKQES